MNTQVKHSCPNPVACRTCLYQEGTTSSNAPRYPHCLIYSEDRQLRKPDEVYYEGHHCPHYLQAGSPLFLNNFQNFIKDLGNELASELQAIPFKKQKVASHHHQDFEVCDFSNADLNLNSNLHKLHIKGEPELDFINQKAVLVH